jgi:hypothetical protein
VAEVTSLQPPYGKNCSISHCQGPDGLDTLGLRVVMPAAVKGQGPKTIGQRTETLITLKCQGSNTIGPRAVTLVALELMVPEAAFQGQGYSNQQPKAEFWLMTRSGEFQGPMPETNSSQYKGLRFLTQGPRPITLVLLGLRILTL